MPLPSLVMHTETSCCSYLDTTQFTRQKVSPRARNDASRMLFWKWLPPHLSSSKPSQNKYAVHFENKWINQRKNKSSDARWKGREIAMAWEFCSCCSLPSTLPGDWPRRKHLVTKKDPTGSTPWCVQKSILIHWTGQCPFLMLCSTPMGRFTAVLWQFLVSLLQLSNLWEML